jgi:SAM-dependent methyltransferase
MLDFARRTIPAPAKRAIREAVQSVQRHMPPTVFANHGHCPCCDRDTWFRATGHYFRNHYRCESCASLPRERALMWVIEHYRPNWRELTIHESSPVRRGASVRVAEAPGYIASQYFDGIPSGATHDGWRSENLEALSFPDASIDLHVTQDVLEHVYDPDACFRELARTLKPGGMHIFTVPLVNGEKPTECRASLVNGAIVHHKPPEYHGNPVLDSGSLMTMDWGFDICARIAKASGLWTEIVSIDRIDSGIRAELNEVLVSRKF